MGGFMKDFAYGFSQTAPEVLKERAAQTLQQQKYDEELQLRVKSVDPESELYQRQQDILTAEDAKKRQQRLQDEMQGLHGSSPELQQDYMSTVGAGSQPVLANPIPQPTIAQPNAPAPNMAPAGNPPPAPQPFMANPNAAPAPEKEPDHFALANEYKTLEARAYAAGDKEGAEQYRIMSDLHKNQSDHALALTKTEPIPNKSAEGINVNEQLIKDAKENEKAFGTSFYLPTEMSQVAAPSQTYKGDSYYAETVHTPLAQAEMAHQRVLTPNKPEEEVFGIVKQHTLEPTSDIVTLQTNDPHITPARKQQAMIDLMRYMKSTYGNDVDGAIAKDKNLQHVFNTKLLAVMTALSNQGKVQPSVTTGD